MSPRVEAPSEVTRQFCRCETGGSRERQL